jgi:DNA invertase Pin-like site-specific DNA recombinase
MTNNKALRVALYSRVSTKYGKQDVENQLAQLREYCDRQGWTIVHEYVDHASGKRSDRAAFLEMFDAASRREFDCLLFWSLDRLSREGVVQTLQHLQRLTACGVHYKSFTEQYLDSVGVFQDAVIGILATIAKQERIRISERTLAGLARARKNGKVIGRPKVIVNRDKIARLHAEGQSLSKIASEFGISKATAHNIVRAASA